ncbi:MULTISPECIES: Csu type fimbrial protein [Enterobacter]|uniref:Spore coat protein U domain-containing protein n=1 Tax=Enterobacter pasteurii TaxID=3029761 RepID=A0ABR9Q3S0_9ENTR|nr:MULTISPECIES: spore coat protein U domain-containing protein [Enterobacter]MCM7513983.1 spore coat protein U domain-containing protein [Enterobacter hormaechei]MBE4853477.1 spore coat protein U domain-containing protein [Enterobacter pasteurii]MBE4862671.1 spore coat protein U domain-containing protein [Enterobacter cloacae complex sp. P40C2]MBE4875194.1 spore coat protein U domain-containing protein [Enterobacter cloacae complex sp. P40C]MCI2292640.1 spore coat protein U domain-containing 
MRIIPTVVCCSVLLLPAAAIAADSTASATMHVSLEVVKSCTLNANDLNFSRHGSDETSEIQAKTQVDIVCTNGTPFTLSATSNDSSENGTFWLKPDNGETGAQKIAWKLFADEGKQTQITGTDGLTDTGNGMKQEETLYGVIDAGALTAAQAGTYSDDITLNLVY